jgi:hypothetical protein
MDAQLFLERAHGRADGELKSLNLKRLMVGAAGIEPATATETAYSVSSRR